MRQRVGSIGVAAQPRSWTHRFTFVLLIAAAFGVMLVGKADTIVIAKARTTVIDAISPVMEAISRPIGTVRNAAADVHDYFSLKAENAALQQQNEALLEWKKAARQLQAQNASLRELLHLTPDPTASFVTAPVIADASSSFVRSVIVMAGAKDHVVKGQAAMTGAGLAGRVLEVGERASRVLLLTDINARAPVVIERTRDQAVLAGNNSEFPELRYLPRDVDIKVGDRVVTSGIGGNYPAALPVGEVSRIDGDRIYVELFVKLDRVEYLRLVNYGLPGILSEDLGVDTAANAQPKSAGITKGQ